MTDTVKRLHRIYNRHRNWHAKVQAHIHDGAEYPSLRLMPSKDSKYQGYDAARTVAAHRGIEVPAEFAGTMHEWAYVLAAAGVKVQPLPASIPTKEGA